jgi:dTDP-4-amino-4,6-dideoxygalactose transaminase
MPTPRLYLSPPHIGPDELTLVQEAFATNWIAPLGPHVDAFERELATMVGARHAAALSSGTAALHLGLKLCGVGAGDEVICSTLTFSASANPIVYEGARPVFIDSDDQSWNLDPALLEVFLAKRAVEGRVPKALVLVHLYGQAADIDPVLALCARYGVTVIEDAAEALGATYRGRTPGVFGRCGIYSFNGNKIITTSGGGMLVSDDENLIRQARFLATQARDPAPHYQHSHIGYNYRLSNVLAGIGRGQLRVLAQRVEARRRINASYRRLLGDLPGLTFMPEADYGRSNGWLTCVQIDPSLFGADREQVRLALEARNIESRPVWKPLHLQPIFERYEVVGGKVSERLFARGLCLPSGSAMTEADVARVVEAVRACACA